MKKIKTALVHDWLKTYAGSERVVESLVNIFPEADIFTLVNFLNDSEKKIILKGKETKTSYIQKLWKAETHYRNYLPLFPSAIEQFDLSDYDLIISSSHAVAKGVLTNSNQVHICYCHTPIRYAWDLTFQYLRESNLQRGLKGMLAKAVLHYIRIWDVNSSNRVDHFIANSNYIARRIKKIYRRDAEVIYPPVDVDKFIFNGKKEDFYLTASRMVPYKKIDIIVEAFSLMPDKKLYVIGDGPDYEKIRSKARGNIEFLGYMEGPVYIDYMQRAKGFIFAAEEDFGITVVEALSCGTPVIALDKGGTAETIQHKQNGIHFSEQTPAAIKNAVKELDEFYSNFNFEMISSNAKKYSRKIFEEKMMQFVNSKVSEFSGEHS